jgi:hypothetical protein
VICGDRVSLRDGEGEMGMVVATTGDGRVVVCWDVPEESPYSTEAAADLLVTKGVYKSQRRGYHTRSEAGRAR